jgi:hypothetical protein
MSSASSELGLDLQPHFSSLQPLLQLSATADISEVHPPAARSYKMLATLAYGNKRERAEANWFCWMLAGQSEVNKWNASSRLGFAVLWLLAYNLVTVRSLPNCSNWRSAARIVTMRTSG